MGEGGEWVGSLGFLKNLLSNNFGFLKPLPALTHPDQSLSVTTLSAPIAHLLAGLCALWALAGHYPAMQGWDWPLYHMAYGATFRTVFSAALAHLIYACQTRPTAVVSGVLSHRVFVPLSVLSYSAYLVHVVPVVVSLFAALHPPAYRGVWAMAGVCALQLVVSYGYALVCYLLTERPAMVLERVVAASGRVQQGKKRE